MFQVSNLTEGDGGVFFWDALCSHYFHVSRVGGNDLLQKLMASVIFQKVTLHLAQRLFSADLYLFKGGLWLSAIKNALTNNWAVCHLEFI